MPSPARAAGLRRCLRQSSHHWPVYEAGIPRAVRSSGDRETAVARGLIEQANLIEQVLDDLAGRQFNREAAAQIVELHGRVTRSLLPHTGDVWLSSFVSKYLHFHCDIVPIYDSRAEEAIGHLVDWKLVGPIRESMSVLPDWVRAYRNFTAAFVVLWERVMAESSVAARVKEIDHLLWQSA